MECYHENYFLIGPYFPQNVHGEFLEKLPPDFLRPIFESVKREGIQCHYGHWLIPGNPNTILVDFAGYAANKNTIKARLWDEFRIDSLFTEFHDYDEPVIWASAIGRVLEEVVKAVPNKKIVAHFHEWLSGVALLCLKIKKVRIGTVFTTHATMLGRTLASHNINLYDELSKIDPEKAAYDYKVATKHQTERQCAQNAHVFTTVSEITGMEAEHFFKRKPDILLMNGLDLSKFPTFEETTIKHRLFKNRIKEFLMYYFFPFYSFDLDKTRLYFICGRYEFHDKGIDILIKALRQLNDRLKVEKSPLTVVCFFWIPGNIRSIKPQLLESKTFFNEVKDNIEESLDEVKNKLIYGMVAEHKISQKTLFDREALDDISRKVMKLKKSGTPSLTTHDLFDEPTDPIVNALKENGLLNKKEDRVKVVFYSIYLTGADGLLDISYYESMQGCQLGIFPSFYEPWGYTPLEAGALGVPAVTTDLAGFGRYIAPKLRPEQPGIYVLHRFNKTNEEAVAELGNIMYDYTNFSKEERVQAKIEAKKLAGSADWKVFIEFYIKAHNLAVERANKP
jgi:glycogen(starch) synthase